VNADFYIKVLGELDNAIQRKGPNLKSHEVILLHDNAKPHTAARTHNFLECLGWIIFSHPAYLPDLAPSDF